MALFDPDGKNPDAPLFALHVVEDSESVVGAESNLPFRLAGRRGTFQRLSVPCFDIWLPSQVFFNHLANERVVPALNRSQMTFDLRCIDKPIGLTCYHPDYNYSQDDPQCQVCV